MAKRDETLERIFEEPTRADVTWQEVENMIKRHGGKVKNGKGSRRRIVFPGAKGSLHEPHPQKEMKKYAVEDLRELLKRAGIEPDLKEPTDITAASSALKAPLSKQPKQK